MLNKLNISPGKQKFIVYTVLTLVTLAVFWQVNQFDFVNFDDVVYIIDNFHIQQGITLDGFRWAFSTRYFNLWTPLVWFSFMFDYQMHGLHAGGYHLTNLILHILSTLLLFRLFNRMTGAIWRSAFVAALFALHPLHVESVAWIAERKDVLSAFFWMLTLCLYVYYVEKPDIKKYLLVLCGFVLALMSKPMVVTLPLIMILLDYWPLGRFKSKNNSLVSWQLKEKIPFFLLSAVIVIITFHTPDNTPSELFPFGSRLANTPVSFVTYLEKTFWPHDMTVFYPFPAQTPLWQILGAMLLIIIISIAVIVMAKRLPYLFVGWFWYAITIIPVIGIIQVGNFAMADRYHYLPSIGIAVMLAWGIPLMFPPEDTRRKILFPAAIAFIAVMSILTWRQCGYWKNNIDLWNHALAVTKNNYMAHNNLASALFEKKEFEGAVYHYNKALGITPYAPAYYNLGVIYYLLGQHQRAIENYNEAIRIKPDYAAAYYNRGIAYHVLGQYPRAIESYNDTIRLIPYYADAYNNRALVYLNLGNKDIGCSDARKACALGVCKTLEAARVKGRCH